MTAPIFKCTKCGATYSAKELLHGDPSLSIEERAGLRKSWYKAIDKLNALIDQKADAEKIKNAEKNEVATCAAYLNTNVWYSYEVPDDLVTIKDSKGHRLECRTHHPEVKSAR